MADFNWRNSGDGRYMREQDAKRLPSNQVEKERRKDTPKPNPKKGK